MYKLTKMLQQCQTFIERLFAIGLFVNGLSEGLFAQYQILLDGDSTRADFAYDYFISECRLAIYCDGFNYHSSAEALSHDRQEDRELQLKGWKVLRFMRADLCNDLNKCVETIRRSLVKNTRNNRIN